MKITSSVRNRSGMEAALVLCAASISVFPELPWAGFCPRAWEAFPAGFSAGAGREGLRWWEPSALSGGQELKGLAGLCGARPEDGAVLGSC